jgi:putative nucleotidyltransferase with HDIG domain
MPTLEGAPYGSATPPTPLVPDEGLRARVAERLRGKLDLPLLPQVAGQVLVLAGSANVDALALSGLIHRDPALAGQVLRIANSPAYMPSMPIVSLQQAVARLGLQTVTEIAIAASLQSGTFRVPGYESELKRLWRHAIASGAFAKEIARLLRVNVETAFLCGLFHAIGKPAVLQVICDVQREQGGISAASADVWAMLEAFHTAVGLVLAKHWALSTPVITAVGYHACYQKAPAARQEATLTCLADRLATDLVDPQPGFDDALRTDPVLADLNLYPDAVTRLLGLRPAVARTVESMTT